MVLVKMEKLGITAPCMFVGYSHDHDGDWYCMYNPKMKTRDVIWPELYYQKQYIPGVQCEPWVYMTKFKSPETKIENESNKLLEGDPSVDVSLEAGKETESVGIKEINSNSSNTFWHTIKTWKGWIIILLVCLMDETKDTGAEMNYYALLAE